MERNTHQGYYGEAYMRALAAASGIVATTNDLDIDGVDLYLSYPGPGNLPKARKIEVQVKTWRDASGTDDVWRYPLRVKNYNDLAGETQGLPIFLVLIVVPEKNVDYITNTHECMTMSHGAYWVSLESFDPLTGVDKDSTKTVDVPKANLLTSDSLISLVNTAYGVPA